MYVWCGTSVTTWDKRHTVGQASFRFVPGTKRDKRLSLGQNGTSVTTWDKPRRHHRTPRPGCAALVAPRQSIRRPFAASRFRPVSDSGDRSTVRALVAPWLRRRIRHHRRKRAENALASRPPSVPCPRPSEMRRAFCKPFSTVCNAGKDSPASPAPPSASRPPFAPWLRRPGCAAPWLRRASLSGDRSPRPASGLSAIPATVRPFAPWLRPGCAAGFATIAGNAPKTPLQAVRRPSRVRVRPKCAVRFASRFRPFATRARIRPPVPRRFRQAVRADSGNRPRRPLSIYRKPRPLPIRRHRPPVYPATVRRLSVRHHRPRRRKRPRLSAGKPSRRKRTPPPSEAATVRPCRKRPRLSAGNRSTVATVRRLSAGKPSAVRPRRRIPATVRQSIRRPFDRAAGFRQAVTPEANAATIARAAVRADSGQCPPI